MFFCSFKSRTFAMLLASIFIRKSSLFDNSGMMPSQGWNRWIRFSISSIVHANLIFSSFSIFWYMQQSFAKLTFVETPNVTRRTKERFLTYPCKHSTTLSQTCFTCSLLTNAFADLRLGRIEKNAHLCCGKALAALLPSSPLPPFLRKKFISWALDSASASPRPRWETCSRSVWNSFELHKSWTIRCEASSISNVASL